MGIQTIGQVTPQELLVFTATIHAGLDAALNDNAGDIHYPNISFVKNAVETYNGAALKNPDYEMIDEDGKELENYNIVVGSFLHVGDGAGHDFRTPARRKWNHQTQGLAGPGGLRMGQKWRGGQCGCTGVGQPLATGQGGA